MDWLSLPQKDGDGHRTVPEESTFKAGLEVCANQVCRRGWWVGEGRGRMRCGRTPPSSHRTLCPWRCLAGVDSCP